MQGRVLSLICLVVLLGCGCGGGSDDDHGVTAVKVTPSAEVKQFNGDVSPGNSREHAEAIVKHQREYHCRQRLKDVSCQEEADSWYCRWHTSEGSGATSLEKDSGGRGIPVSCP